MSTLSEKVEALVTAQTNVQAQTHAETDIQANDVIQETESDPGFFRGIGPFKYEDSYDSFRGKAFSQVSALPIDLFVPHDMQNLFKKEFKEIRITGDVLEIPSRATEGMPPSNGFGPHRIPFIHLKIDESTKIVTVLSTQDVNQGYSNYVIGAGFAEREPDREIDNEMLLKIVKIKVLNGDTNYNKREKGLLREWITSIGVSTFMRLLKEIAFRNQTYKLPSYSTSVLKKTIEEVAATSTVSSQKVETKS